MNLMCFMLRLIWMERLVKRSTPPSQVSRVKYQTVELEREAKNVIHHGYIDNGSGRYLNVYASASQKKKKKEKEIKKQN